MRRLLAVAFWVAFFVPASAEAASLQCVPREPLLEVLVSQGGSFTAFLTFPDGLICPVATGEGWRDVHPAASDPAACDRSEEHTSELQSLMRNSYAVFCLKKKKEEKVENGKNND